MPIVRVPFKTWCLAACSSLTLAAVPAIAASDAPAASGARPAPTTDRLIVAYRDGTEADPADARITRAREMAGDALTTRLEGVNRLLGERRLRGAWLRQMSTGAHVLQLDRALPVSDMARLAAVLAAADPRIAYVEPDRPVYAAGLTGMGAGAHARAAVLAAFKPNDPLYARQWPLHDATAGIRAPSAWRQSRGDGVVVGIVGSGSRPHPDLRGQSVSGYDFIKNAKAAQDGSARDGDPTDMGEGWENDACGTGIDRVDSAFSGTQLAGLVAAKASNDLGLVGVAPGARIQHTRVIGKCYTGYTSDALDAMAWTSGGRVPQVPVNKTPARVMLIPWVDTNTSCNQAFQQVIDSARARGTVIVVTSGLGGESPRAIRPANCRGVVVVSGINRWGTMAVGNSYGDEVTLTAPVPDFAVAPSASEIWSTSNAGPIRPSSDNHYAPVQNTWTAAAYVAGVAALMVSVNPLATPDQIKGALQRSARPFPGVCTGCGAGMLDAAAAVEAVGRPEVEPNGTPAEATRVVSPTSMYGSIDVPGGADHFVVQLPPNTTLTATLTSADFKRLDLAFVQGPAANTLRRVNDWIVQGSATTGPAAQKVVLRVNSAAKATGRYNLWLQWGLQGAQAAAPLAVTMDD